MFNSVITWLESIAQSTPLPMFALLGGIVEEILAPLPSPLVSALAGSILAAQESSIPYILWICALLTVSKALGGWLFYVIGDKFEDIVVPRFGKYLGVSHEDLEKFGKYFTGTWRDGIILLIIRAIPVMPSTPISLVCGLLKTNLRVYLLATYAGFYVRNLTFIILGYTGISAFENIMAGIDTAETALKVLIVVGALAVLGWLYYRRMKGKTLVLVKPEAIKPEQK